MNVETGTAAAGAIPFLGINKWDFGCRVHGLTSERRLACDHGNINKSLTNMNVEIWTKAAQDSFLGINKWNFGCSVHGHSPVNEGPLGIHGNIINRSRHT
jgi:hypothetical protein